VQVSLPPSWRARLAEELAAPYFKELCAFVDAERAAHVVHPDPEHVFAAFDATHYDDVRVVLLGQDPYPTPGHAHGLCFSVQPGVKPPASLKNIFKELADDLDVTAPSSGCLLPWARQGVLLLNTVLTVRSGEANSHQGKGWERFTDAVIRAVDAKRTPVVFVLWGNAAQKKRALVDESRHFVVAGAHPSPLSAKRWFGSRPFSQINAALVRAGSAPIDFHL
jgi:uracil-DNA glycosylase